MFEELPSHLPVARITTRRPPRQVARIEVLRTPVRARSRTESSNVTLARARAIDPSSTRTNSTRLSQLKRMCRISAKETEVRSKRAKEKRKEKSLERKGSTDTGDSSEEESSEPVRKRLRKKVLVSASDPELFSSSDVDQTEDNSDESMSS